jgi:glutamyl-tRNA reductase
LPSLEGAEVVLYGLGKLGRNTCKNLAKHAGKASITVINRDDAKANHAADVYGFSPVSHDELKKAIGQARVLIVATGAQSHTVTVDMVQPGQELLILDMSMPPNVDPAAAELPGVVLVDVDEMSQHALQQLNARKDHFPHAERIVEEELEEFRTWIDSLKVAPLLGAVTQTLRNYRDVELGKLKADGSEDEARLVQLSDKLIQKVTTQVATYLKTKSDKVEEDMEVFGQAFHPSNS